MEALLSATIAVVSITAIEGSMVIFDQHQKRKKESKCGRAEVLMEEEARRDNKYLIKIYKLKSMYIVVM